MGCEIFVLLLITFAPSSSAQNSSWYDKLIQEFSGLQIFNEVVFDRCETSFHQCYPLLVGESRHRRINLNEWTPKCDLVQCTCYGNQFCWAPADCNKLASCSSQRFECLQDHIEGVLLRVGPDCADFLGCATKDVVRTDQDASCIEQFAHDNPSCNASGKIACAYVNHLPIPVTSAPSTPAPPTETPTTLKPETPRPTTTSRAPETTTHAPPTHAPPTRPPLTEAPSSTTIPTSASPEPTSAPPSKISRSAWLELKNVVPEFRLFDDAIIDECGGPLLECSLALSGDSHVTHDAWQHHKQCAREHCVCIGMPPHDSSGACKAAPDDCDGTTRCYSNRKKCFGRWLYPLLRKVDSCHNFSTCSRDSRTQTQELHQCMQAGSCDDQVRCEYVLHPDGEADTVPLSNAPSSSPSSPVVSKVIIGAVVACGAVVCIIGIVVVHSKVRRRRNVVRGPAHAMNIQHVQVHVAEPVRWFGIRQLCKSPSGKGARCSVLSCGSSFGATGRKILLPCRCEWCGCGAHTGAPSAAADWGDRHLPDFNVDARVRAYPGRTIVKSDAHGRNIRTYACNACSSPIDLILDLRNLYVEDVDSARSDSASDSGIPKCCVCLGAPVSIVSLPCCHLSTCADCATRLCKGVPRRGVDPSAVEVSSKCPKCRATCEAMVVLDDDQIADAVAAVQQKR